jgi:hypothetical protein
LDVKSAFLHGQLDEKIYLRPPNGHPTHGTGQVLLLHKALYGLKQASRVWNQLLDSELQDMGLTPSPRDPCLYLWRSGKEVAMVLVYVDDLIIAGNAKSMMKQIKDKLDARFEMKHLGPLRFCLGLLVERDRARRTMALSQASRCLELVTRFGMANCNPAPSPALAAATKVHRGHGSAESNGEVGRTLGANGDGAEDNDQEDHRAQTHHYHHTYQHGRDMRSLVGSLNYIAMTSRPDIAEAVRYLSSHQQQPTKALWGWVTGSLPT